MFLKNINARCEEGFTLVELLITIVILSVFMAIVAPVYISNNKQGADSAATKTQVAQIVTAISGGVGTGGLILNGDAGTPTVTETGINSITSQVGTQAVRLGADKAFIVNSTYIGTLPNGTSTVGTWCVSSGAWSQLSTGVLTEDTTIPYNTCNSSTTFAP